MRVLVLSGGGSKGAYQAGALKYILGELKVSYDAFCGVSVGAINCAILAMFSSGEEKESINYLLDLWNNIGNSSIYKRWFPLGALHILWKHSFYDSSPLHTVIRDRIDLKKIRASGKKATAGTVSLSSGKYTIFDQDSDHFIDAVIASASFPGMLPPVKFLGQLWTDGGVKEISPIKKAIEMGADEIDIIITSPHTRIKHFFEKPSLSDILKRVLDLSTDKIMANDIEKVEMYNKLAGAGLSNKKVVKINILRPDYNLIEDLLDFRPHKVQEMIKKGYDDAKYKYIMQ